jgi:hypothetical protein
VLKVTGASSVPGGKKLMIKQDDAISCFEHGIFPGEAQGLLSARHSLERRSRC